MVYSDYFEYLESEDAQEKFLEIYKAHQRLMYKVAKSVINDDYLAEDIVNETFIKVCREFCLVDDVYSKKTINLLVIMTRNTAIDFYRKRAKTMGREVYLEDLKNFEEIPSPCDYFTEKDDNAEIKNLIMSLPETYKEVLLLKYVNEYSDSEIAEIMNISISNVRKRIERAKKILRNTAKKRGFLNEKENG